MGQKSNPISLRLQYNNLNFDSNWYSDFYYAQCLLKNVSLLEYSKTFMKLLKLPEARLNINLGVKSLKLYSFFCLPKINRFGRSRKFRINTNLSSAWMKKSKYKRNSQSLESAKYSLTPRTLLENPSFHKASSFLSDIERNRNLEYLFQQIEYLETNKDLSSNQKTFLNEQQFKLRYFLLQYFSLYQGITLNNPTNIVFSEQNFHEFFETSTLSFPQMKKLALNYSQNKEIQIQKTLRYQNYLSNFYSSNSSLTLQHIPFNLNQDFQSAGFLADEIVYFLEKKVSFSRIKNKIFQEVENLPWIQGIRIKYSGRVGGKSKKAQRAKHECVKYGQTSLHIFDHQIDYASRKAATPFGSVGIKVWICYA